MLYLLRIKLLGIVAPAAPAGIIPLDLSAFLAFFSDAAWVLYHTLWILSAQKTSHDLAPRFWIVYVVTERLAIPNDPWK